MELEANSTPSLVLCWKLRPIGIHLADHAENTYSFESSRQCLGVDYNNYLYR